MKVVYFGLVGIVCLQMQANGADKKALSAQAESLVKEGQALEGAKKYQEARQKYVRASGLDAKKGGKALAKLDSDLAEKSKALVLQAKASFEKKDYPGSVKALKEADDLKPGQAVVSCNLAVSHKTMGDRANALPAVDACIAQLTKKDEKTRFEQLKTQIETGEETAKLSETQKQAIVTLNKEIADQTQKLHPDRPEVGDAAASGSAGKPVTLCGRLMSNKDTLPKTPSVLYNLARCAESEGSLEDAGKYMELYLAANPETAKDEEIAASHEQIKEVLAQQGEQSEGVKTAFSTAQRYIHTGRLKAALAEYENLVKLAPNLARAQWRLALFYEAMGDVAKAKAGFDMYASLVTDPAEKKRAQDHAGSLDERMQKYQVVITEVEDILKPGRRGGNAPTTIAGFQELYQQAEDKARLAQELFPLAAEVNTILGYVNLQKNYAPGARNSFDALTLHDKPVNFSAQTTEKSGGKNQVYVSSINLEADGIRVLPFTRYDKKTKKSIPLACHDQIINSGLSTKIRDCGEFIPTKSLKTVEVHGAFLVVTAGPKEYHLLPLNEIQLIDFSSAPATRKYANRYARLMTRYSGFDGTKLGKEGFTGMEKFGKVVEVAAMAYAGGGIGLLNSVNRAALVMTAAFASMATIQVIQGSRSELRSMLQQDAFKAIPVDPAPLAFRLDNIR